MKTAAWQWTVLSDVDYENLVAEVLLDGQFILLLDREQGRDAMAITFPTAEGKPGARMPLEEFITRLRETAADLQK